MLLRHGPIGLKQVEPTRKGGACTWRALVGGEGTMGKKQRIMLAVGILVVDSVLFFFPFGALFLAYILIVNPPWFRQMLSADTPPSQQ